MSEEFEDISVATEIAPVAEPAGGVEAPSMPVADATPSEVAATQIDLDASNESLENNAKQVYLETFAPERAGGNAPITSAGIAAKEEEREEKRAALQDALDDQEKQFARHKQWMESQHEFGGMKMSGADLDKLMNFYSNNPQMLDKLKERMTKSGMPKDKIEKGVKELQEALDIQKKEKNGTATDEDRSRYQEIQNSEEFRVASQQAVNIANQAGLAINVETGAEKSKAATELDGAERGNVDVLVDKRITEAQTAQRIAQEQGVQLQGAQQQTVEQQKIDQHVIYQEAAKTTKVVSWSAASSKDDLPKTVELTSLYNDKSAGQVAVNQPDAPKMQQPQVVVAAARVEASVQALM